MEISFSFMLPATCHVKRKIDCVGSDEDQVELTKSHMGQ
jgi:hypothetical protein